MRSERAFGGTKVYGITVDCLTILKKNRQAKVRAASECRIMRDERIAEWRRNRCWPKG